MSWPIWYIIVDDHTCNVSCLALWRCPHSPRLIHTTRIHAMQAEPQKKGWQGKERTRSILNQEFLFAFSIRRSGTPWGAKNWKTRNMPKQLDQKFFITCPSQSDKMLRHKEIWWCIKGTDSFITRSHLKYCSSHAPIFWRLSGELWFRPTYWSCVSVKRSKPHREWGIRVRSEVKEPRDFMCYSQHSFMMVYLTPVSTHFSTQKTHLP